MKKINIKNLLNDYSLKANALLAVYLKEKIRGARFVGKIPTEILKKFAEMMTRGKKIRGFLTVLGYRLAGGKDLNSIYDASCFIEIMHSGALIHDDIMDKDNLRRGLPAMHRQFENYGEDIGVSLAICAGDLAFYLSWDKLLHSRFSDEIILKAAKIYAKYAINITYGQSLDQVNGLERNFNLQEILKIFRYKTAEYTGVTPLIIGAILGGMTDKKKLAAIEGYGLNLGWAFQIQDDILGLYGSETETGKPIGSDLRQGKITLLVYHILKNGSLNEKLYLKSILGRKDLSQTDILKAQKFFKDTGAYQYVLNLGKNYLFEGKKTILQLTENPEIKEILESLLNFIMSRIV
ncbi:hypothetical protein A2774_04655 [Candidatus Roizmanbacteria bacterium RIFCSPHIGHO2_01_FULL_39_12c]|uniref:Polyprenyl synthetase n=1 Tax=Candidatus Roizmanbacteria bacterium RIFCSPHIGHO2_01_FULL_39_12c TaxID=1802031 RepID=A0A1F7GBM3_9BACT|nr:MAG: hypothetical protein A2774_04655 [Candidatus Roizmanbacteria bacterium RIFCSPHIGHO2_01_FULL_39_12c]OGK47868.1 MAG: hypothetical protein A2963_03380 [Candidatus Roizmanbacteria bacterium RIFCSPLOWO2_01_FULL_40_13]